MVFLKAAVLDLSSFLFTLTTSLMPVKILILSFLQMTLTSLLFLRIDLNHYKMANKLHINTRKSCYIEFSKRLSRENTMSENAPTMDQKLFIDDFPLERVESTKFLGVTIDKNLNWDEHRARLSKKLATCSGILNRIKDNIPQELHKDLYHTLFESHLTYSITVWGGVSEAKL